MSTTSPQTESAHRDVNRREFLRRGSAVGVGALAAGGAGSHAIGSPVGDAQAIAPAVIVGAAGVAIPATTTAIGWAVESEWNPFAEDQPDEGLTGPALRATIERTARARKSANRSSFIDNANILEGLEELAYTDGKVAALEAINNEESEQAVKDAAEEASDDYFATVMENFLKGWNESAEEFHSLLSAVEDHPDVEEGNGTSGMFAVWDKSQNDDHATHRYTTPAYYEEATTLPDGSEFNVKVIEAEESENHDLNPADPVGSDWHSIRVNPSEDNGEVIWLDHIEWRDVYTQIETAADDVRSGLNLWVEGVYADVQAGEIELEELLTPRERAEMMSDDEEFPQAVADLMALNVPVDVEREATIEFLDRNVTISGILMPTSEPVDGFITGGTYDPAAADWDLYFTYDRSVGSAGWEEFEETMDGRELVFTSEPFPETLYRVETNDGTKNVYSEDFEQDGNVWVADLSEQADPLVEEFTDYEEGIDGGTMTFTTMPDDAIEFEVVTVDEQTEMFQPAHFTEVNGDYEAETEFGITSIEQVTVWYDRAYVEEEDDTIEMYDETGDHQYETVQIQEPFEITKILDSAGEEAYEAEFSTREPHTDDNYITQEEWDEQSEQMEDLINTYEESLEDDSGLGLPGFGDWDGIDGFGSAAAGIVMVGVLLLALYQGAVSALTPGR